MKSLNRNPETLDAWIRRRAVDGVDIMPDGVHGGFWDGEEWYSVWIPIADWDGPVAGLSKSHCSCGAGQCIHRETVWHLVMPLLGLVVPGSSWATFWKDADLPTEFGPGATYLRERLQQIQDQSRRRAWTELAYHIYDTKT